MKILPSSVYKLIAGFKLKKSIQSWWNYGYQTIIEKKSLWSNSGKICGNIGLTFSLLPSHHKDNKVFVVTNP